MTSLFLSLFLSLVAILGYHISSGRRSSLANMGNALASSASPWLNSVQPGDPEQNKKSVFGGQMEGIWCTGAFPSTWKSYSLSLGGFQPPIDPSGLSPKSPPLGRLPWSLQVELDTPALGNLLFYYCINHKAVIETFAFHSITQGLFWGGGEAGNRR